MSRGTLLFLDDDADLQSLISTYLRDRGYRVESARTAAEAREVLARVRVDATIVDGMLPGMSGVEFIQELRQTEPTLPIVFASAFWKDLTSHDHLNRQLRVARVVHKPYTPQELFFWVEQVLAEPADSRSASLLEGASDEVITAMAALSSEYGAQLGEKIRLLTAVVDRVLQGERESLREAYLHAHKLHGTAGSCGFGAVSAAAGRLEALLKQARDDKAPVDPGSVRRALRELAEVAQGAVSTLVESAGPVQSQGTVLVADEDEAWLAEVERMGKDLLVRVVTARSADEVVAAARRRELDGALLHVNLGGREGGFTTAARLRGEDGLQSLPLAFFGTEGDVAYRVAAAHAGASLYLPRPFSARDLTEAVERMVAARRPERSRVLVLDDDPEAVRVLSAALTSALVEVVGIGDPYRLVEALAEHRPDLLLLDVEMPGPSGFDLCRIVRSMPEWRELPILFITTHTGVEFRVAAFRSGADDYLAKPVLREELWARVQSRLERTRLARERAERDALTGLLLRRPFLDNLRARLADAQRLSRPLTLGFLDVDHFKKVNDTHGHLAGDRVLMQMGRLLATRFRREDLRCRWGGEEFVVALLGATADRARDILARTAAELSRIEFEGDKGQRFRVTFSAGLAEMPGDGADLETLLRLADERLYRAKVQGRNRIEL